ncbi:MAG: hypothetical protein MUO43_12490 [Desulfobacterales bacterium]|nr:hypothetical protein [Desulfobacterales bacterium]
MQEMVQTELHQIPRLTKLFSWLILGSFSVFFAEVISGSSMFPFFTPWGIIGIFPVYTLHILVLSYIVFNYGKPSFSTLFIAGAIFGMYEAYLTKVLWSPTWGEPVVLIGGVAAVETIMLVLFRHPFLSFIIPLIAAEHILTDLKETLYGLPCRLQKLFYLKKNYLILPMFALLTGAYQSGNSPSPIFSLLSVFSTTGLLILLIYLWRTKINNKNHNMQELLPSKHEFRIILTLLILMYIVFGLFIRPQALPGLFPQLTIWLIYAGLFGLLYLSLKRSRETSLHKIVSPITKISYRTCIRLSLIFALTSAMLAGLGIGSVMMILMWISGVLIGILVLMLVIKDIFA